jgi:predicted  nucleic acid-binding Zn-ribbon protein
MIEIKNILQHHGDLLTEIIKQQNHLRSAFEQMNERFGSLETRVGALETRVNTVEIRINEVESRLSKEIREVFKWMVGMMIPVWIGVLLGVLVQLIKG